MPRYSYIRLRVMCYDVRDFAIEDLRGAVEYLKTQRQTEHTGLAAIAAVVDAGPFKLGPKPMLHLDQIVGRMPAEVWELFDRDVDAQREGLARRSSGFRGASEPVS